jgi:hypothetical protein
MVVLLCSCVVLMSEDVLEKTWGDRLNPWDGKPRARGQFWPPCIKDVKKVNKKRMLFVADCYWDRNDYELVSDDDELILVLVLAHTCIYMFDLHIYMCMCVCVCVCVCV